MRLFSDPAECGGGIADSGWSRECAEGGMSSDNTIKAKKKVPGNHMIEIDQDEKEGDTFIQQSIRGVPHNDELSTQSVREKSLIPIVFD